MVVARVRELRETMFKVEQRGSEKGMEGGGGGAVCIVSRYAD